MKYLVLFVIVLSLLIYVFAAIKIYKEVKSGKRVKTYMVTVNILYTGYWFAIYLC
jgi:hypothetical protein